MKISFSMCKSARNGQICRTSSGVMIKEKDMRTMDDRSDRSSYVYKTMETETLK